MEVCCLPGVVHSAMIANLLCESVLCLPGVVHSAMIAYIWCESMKVCICLGNQLSESERERVIVSQYLALSIQF